jgi:hypothetical protein
MPKLAVAAAGAIEIPTILLEHPQYISNFHLAPPLPYPSQSVLYHLLEQVAEEPQLMDLPPLEVIGPDLQEMRNVTNA